MRIVVFGMSWNLMNCGNLFLLWSIELAALGDEVEWGQEETTPTYLQAVAPSMGEPTLATQQNPPGANPYNLPSVPQGELANW